MNHERLENYKIFEEAREKLEHRQNELEGMQYRRHVEQMTAISNVSDVLGSLARYLDCVVTKA